MKLLHLSPSMSLPIDIITMRTAVFGVSGSGKSTFGRLLAERIHEARQRFCVIDLKNDWWGLKSSADGKSPAIPIVIIGGPRADIPLEPEGGAAVADIVAELPHSFVIDLDSLSKGKGIRFLGAFLERLYDVNREPLLLICDEADRYGPQKPMSPEAHVTLGASDDIARRGRKRGIGSLWLSQRPAVINKNITSQCELVVTFRTPSELDQKELRAHLGRVASEEQVTETMRCVGGLANGEAIFVSQHPALHMFKRAQMPMPQTFDSSATPRIGERRIEPRELAAPDLAALGERIKATVDKAKAADPIALRRRIVELERELAKKPATVVAAPTKIERVEKVANQALHAVDMLQRVADGLRMDLARATAKPTPAPARAIPIPRIKVAAARPAPQSVDGGEVGNSGLRRMLIALAQRPQGLNGRQIGVRAGMSSKSGTFSTYLSRARAQGWISGSGHLRITDAGVAALGSYDPLPEGPELAAYWLRELGNSGAARILRTLLDAYPEAIPVDVLGERAEISHRSGTFSTYLSRLRALELITGRGELRASEELIS